MDPVEVPRIAPVVANCGQDRAVGAAKVQITLFSPSATSRKACSSSPEKVKSHGEPLPRVSLRRKNSFWNWPCFVKTWMPLRFAWGQPCPLSASFGDVRWPEAEVRIRMFQVHPPPRSPWVNQAGRRIPINRSSSSSNIARNPSSGLFLVRFLDGASRFIPWR